MKIEPAVAGSCILAAERTVARVGTLVVVVFEDGVGVLRKWELVGAEFGLAGAGVEGADGTEGFRTLCQEAENIGVEVGESAGVPADIQAAVEAGIEWELVADIQVEAGTEAVAQAERKLAECQVVDIGIHRSVCTVEAQAGKSVAAVGSAPKEAVLVRGDDDGTAEAAAALVLVGS